MKLSKSISEINNGDILEISTTDQGFKNDVYNWAKSSKNTVIDVKEENKIIKAFVKKGIENNLKNEKFNHINENKKNKTIVVFSNDLDKALASFVIANGALSVGRKVTLFFTFWGLNVLRKEENMTEKVSKGLLDKMFGMMMPKGINKLSLSKMNMFGLGTFMMKYVMKKKNILTLQELIKQAKDNGARFIACQMSMDVMGIKKEELIDGVEIGGVATYINDAENSDMNLFI
jgi:peroxiredoxin family protein/TusA-related sulfurtransferase